MYEGREFQGPCDVTEMIYPPIIYAFVDKSNRQIVKNLASVLFNTQVKSLKNNVHICTLRNVMIASLLQYNYFLKVVAGDTNMITVVLLQGADV